jgi:tetratricopeptide (TPR) repeat protein
MTPRPAVLLIVLGLVLPLLLPGPASAAQDDPRLVALFASLRATKDGAEGARLGRRIAAIWLESGDAEIDRLMREGRGRLEFGDLLAALKSFERVTELAPGFAEGWTKRAQVLYRMGDFSAAMTHLGRALVLEPRHFLALAGLGLVRLELGREPEALAAFEEALAINPHLSGVRRQAEALRAKLEGGKP